MLAAQSGLMEGDKIVKIDGEPVLDSLALVNIIRQSPGKTLALDVLRNNEPVSITLTPEAKTVKDS